MSQIYLDKEGTKPGHVVIFAANHIFSLTLMRSAVVIIGSGRRLFPRDSIRSRSTCPS
jgi:hypothetical protein